MTRRCLLWLPASLGLLLLFVPSAAQAHLVQTGFGGFYDGLAHLFVTPGDLLLVISLALLAGLAGKAPSRTLLFVLPTAWLIGGWILPRILSGAPPATLAPVLFGTAGVLIALDRPMTRTSVLLIAAMGGALQGWSNGLTLEPDGPAGLPLWGAAAAVAVLGTLLCAWIVSLRAPWTRIVVRVAGSWMAAIGLLMLGWLLR